jgi:coenzyme F420 hydrogenase subunit beta
MVDTPPGYARPVGTGPIAPAAEALIAKACPGAVVAPWPDSGSVDPYWGPFRRIATGHATDPQTRFEGSSGGALSALLIHALREGLVDRVVHIAPDPAAPTRNVTAISRTPQEVLARSGSRYTASSPLESIDAMLAEGGRFAFVGKPCDVSALRLLGQADPRVAAHVPLVVSFFCGGIPSHDGVGRILRTLGVAAEQVVAFRYRGQGWPGSARALTSAGEAYQMSYAESWGGHLSKEVQFRCKICPDAVGGVADIACADAWYGDEKGYPSFEEEDGRSLIISRSQVGERLVESAVAAGALSVDDLDVTEIIKMQPHQARRKRLVLARTAPLPLLLQPTPQMAGLRVSDTARRGDLPDFARNFLGAIRRTLLGRRSRA